MNNIKVINNVEKEVNITVNKNGDKVEIVIDLVKDFKLSKNLKPGDIFKDIDGEEWIYLYKDMGTGDICILKKEVLKEMKFGSDNNYNGSDVDKYLCGTYLTELERKFGKENIVEFEMDLLSLEGENDYGIIKRKVGIPTFDMYRQNKKSIKNHINKWFWLSTPNSTPSGCGSDDVRCVYSDGYVGCNWCDYYGAVRPFTFLKSTIL